MPLPLMSVLHNNMINPNSPEPGQTFRLLVVDDVHPVLFDRLREIPQLECRYRPAASVPEILAELRECEGLLLRGKLSLDAALLSGFPRLRLIVRAGAGVDNIDQTAACERGITLVHAGEGNRLAVAEHVVGMLLGLFNRLPQSNAEVRRGIWDREGNRGRQLCGLTVGMVGYGNNGSDTAALLSGLGCRVLARDMYRMGFFGPSIQECCLEELQRNADVVSLHVPLTPETHGWVDATFIRACAKQPVLVNAARGEIMVLADAVAALESGALWGACLDVLPLEDPRNWDSPLMNRLFSHPNVLLSPHTAGWTHESYVSIAEVLSSKIIAFLKSYFTGIPDAQARD